MWHFFEGLQNYTENKNNKNENKIIFGDFNCTIIFGQNKIKLDRNDGNKTQIMAC